MSLGAQPDPVWLASWACITKASLGMIDDARYTIITSASASRRRSFSGVRLRLGSRREAGYQGDRSPEAVFKKLLVANRGEIAVRAFRAAYSSASRPPLFTPLRTGGPYAER
jgi:hypothetical protein